MDPIRSEDMQAILVDLRPAPEGLLSNPARRQSLQGPRPPARLSSAPTLGQEREERASIGGPAESPIHTTNAVFGRYMGPPITQPMLARMMVPMAPYRSGGSALMAVGEGSQHSGVQISQGGANVVRLTLSNRVFLKDKHKEKKKKKRPEVRDVVAVQPLLATPQEKPLSGEATPGAFASEQPEEEVPGAAYVDGAGEAPARSALFIEEEEEGSGLPGIPTWIIYFVVVVAVVAMVVFILAKPDLYDSVLPDNPNTVIAYVGRRAIAMGGFSESGSE